MRVLYSGSPVLKGTFSIFEKGLQNCLFLLAEWPPGARNAFLAPNRVLEEAKRDFSSFSSTYHSSSQIHPQLHPQLHCSSHSSTQIYVQLPFQFQFHRPWLHQCRPWWLSSWWHERLVHVIACRSAYVKFCFLVFFAKFICKPKRLHFFLLFLLFFFVFVVREKSSIVITHPSASCQLKDKGEVARGTGIIQKFMETRK